MNFDPSLRAIFNEALDRSDAVERAAYLDGACGADAALRERVEKLLRAHDEAEGFFANPNSGRQPDAGITALFADALPMTEKAGDRIGRYKLLQQIGEGGCGVVYMAEQEEPVRRRVALKVIKLGMDTKQVIARFEAERQALAMMDHPNIARVLDAGATDSGRPFFVMELVKGLKITEFCDQKKLSARERLELFIPVCQAIQHAHQKGIVHRDLKPSNILVTTIDGVAVPKVIDFGIAKATNNQPLTDKTVFTVFDQFIGTPAYMSPEQAELSGVDVDTRTDIYSLGVVLYELLTGKTPFDAQELLRGGLDEIRRTIRETEPPKPSTRLHTLAQADLTTVAQARQTDAPKLVHQVQGDLDWVVMKCLEKDRNRRYESVNGLAMDVQRHLQSEPVVARPPTGTYRLQKLIRRNKLAFAAGTAVVLALLGGITASTWQAVRATRSERAQVHLREQEAMQRMRAEQNELAARKNLYAADLNLAHQSLLEGNLGAARVLLDAHRPSPGQKDLRGFEWRYLWGATRGDHFVTLRGHSNVVASIAISPDGKTVISGSQDQTVRLWDFASRKTIATLPKFSGLVYSVAFSPDGKVFAVGSSSTGMTLWNTERRELLYGAGQNPARVAFSPVGNLLAFGTSKSFFEWDGLSVTLMDYSTGEEIATFPEGGSRAAFSPDGKILALAGRNDAVKLVDVATLKEVGALPKSDAAIALTFTPDGKKLLVAYWGGETRVWDLATQKVEAFLNGHTAKVWCIAFSPDGQTLATASSDQTVRLWDASTWQTKKVLRGHASEIWGVAFTSDGETLVSSSKDETIMLSQLRSTAPTREIIVNQLQPLISPDGLVLAATGEKEQTVLLDIATAQQITKFDGSPVGFVEDGSTLLTFESPASFIFWDVADRSIRSKTTLADGLQPFDWFAVSPDGRTLMTQAGFGPIQIIEIPSAKARGVIPENTGGVRTLAFSPDSRLVATVRWGRLYLWDSASLRQVASDHRHKMMISTCAFSPDGKLLATAGGDGAIVLWEIPSLNEFGRFIGHKEGISCVIFSPDGKTLASSGAGNVKLWNVATFREMATFEHASGFDSLFFSRDGGMLALARNGEPLTILRAPSFTDISAAENALAEKP